MDLQKAILWAASRVLAFVQSSTGWSRHALGANSVPFRLEWREENAGAVGTMADEVPNHEGDRCRFRRNAISPTDFSSLFFLSLLYSRRRDVKW